MKCETCFYFRDPYGQVREGQCHRYPPVVIFSPVSDRGVGLRADFPLVAAGNFCGEYKAVE